MTTETWLEVDDWPEHDPLLHPEPSNRHQVHCLCGRFAKWGGDRHYYNGQYNCYSFDVICGRCGTVTVECV
jgi:hypothetical protein